MSSHQRYRTNNAVFSRSDIACCGAQRDNYKDAITASLSPEQRCDPDPFDTDPDPYRFKEVP
jgi:hypothetical protein